MKFRWIIEDDGSKRLQFEKFWGGSPVWEDVPEIPVSEEYTHEVENADDK